MNPKILLYSLGLLLLLAGTYALLLLRSKPITVETAYKPILNELSTDSFFYPYADSSLPYTITLEDKRLVTVMTLEVRWQPGAFPQHYSVFMKGRLEDPVTGDCNDIELEEMSSWPDIPPKSIPWRY